MQVALLVADALDVQAAVEEGVGAGFAIEDVGGPFLTAVAHQVFLHAILTALAQVPVVVLSHCQHQNNPMASDLAAPSGMWGALVSLGTWDNPAFWVMGQCGVPEDPGHAGVPSATYSWCPCT